MPGEDRDRLFEKALARHLRSEAEAASGSACPDAEALAAYHERLLSPEELSAAKSHLVSCARCQEILAQLKIDRDVEGSDREREPLAFSASTKRKGQEVYAETASGKVARFPARRTALLGWAAPAGAIAAAVLIWIGVRDFRRQESKHTGSPAVQIAENRRDAAPAPEFSPPAPEPFAKQKNDIALQEESRQQPASKSSDILHDEMRGSRAVSKPESNPSDDQKLTPRSPMVAPREATGFGAAGGAGVGGKISAEKKEDFDASRKAALDATKTSPELQPGAANSQAIAGGLPALPPPSAEPAPARAKAATPAPAASSMEIAAQGASSKDKNEPAQYAHTVSSLTSLSVVAPDRRSIWRFGEHGAIGHSSNGGSSWETQTAPLLARLTSGSAPSDKICWIAGESGTLLRTSDRGKHWQIVLTPITADLGGVQASDDQHATIWDAGNHVRYETSDGGITWKQSANH